ncbi:MAG TPA: hypothetical protein VGI40_19815 [Pirellulaceae bacterium]
MPAGKLPPDSVVLDLAFASLKASDDETYTTIWNATDEQPLPPDLRKSLAANGLRVGVFGQNLPTQLVALLDAKPNLLETISSGGSGELDLDGGRRQLPLRAGHRSIINASQVFPNLPVLISDEGNVHGQQLVNARCVLSLKSYPLGDGRVKLSLTPEIEHGEPKARWMGSEGMMIQQTAQDRLTLDRLRSEVVLRPGESLLLGATPDHKGLGEYFFTQTSGGNARNRLLVLRFSQTQFDDLFAREQTSAPLATPGE